MAYLALTPGPGALNLSCPLSSRQIENKGMLELVIKKYGQSNLYIASSKDLFHKVNRDPTPKPFARQICHFTTPRPGS